jgi:hypothetical protein
VAAFSNHKYGQGKESKVDGIREYKNRPFWPSRAYLTWLEKL